MNFLKKLQRSWSILKFTGFRYYRPAQFHEGPITYIINRRAVQLKGQSCWSMIEEIVINDSYHLKEQVKPNTIIDVGSNIGVFSIHASTLFPNSRIFAFEPDKDNFNLLIDNTKAFPNIYCINKALANYDGVGFIEDNSDRTAVQVKSKCTNPLVGTCSTIRLESFLEEHSIDTVDILKLDCEGAEYEIAQSDLRPVNQIVGEYHVTNNNTPEDLKTILIEKNFHIKEWTSFPDQKAGLFWAKRKTQHA